MAPIETSVCVAANLRFDLQRGDLNGSVYSAQHLASQSRFASVSHVDPLVAAATGRIRIFK